MLEAQPKESIVSNGKSIAEIAYEIADMVMDRIKINIDSHMCHSSHFKVGRILIILNNKILQIRLQYF